MFVVGRQIFGKSCIDGKMDFELLRSDYLSHITLFQSFNFIALFFLFSLISLVSFEFILAAIKQSWPLKRTCIKRITRFPRLRWLSQASSSLFKN